MFLSQKCSNVLLNNDLPVIPIRYYHCSCYCMAFIVAIGIFCSCSIHCSAAVAHVLVVPGFLLLLHTIMASMGAMKFGTRLSCWAWADWAVTGWDPSVCNSLGVQNRLQEETICWNVPLTLCSGANAGCVRGSLSAVCSFDVCAVQ